MDKIEKKELGVSLLKTLINSISHVGGLMNEALFEFRGRVKQERINNFIELLSEYFGHNPLINTNVFTTEDFGDLFESVIKRVSSTKSREKHKRFRDVVINYISTADPNIENPDLFLDLVNALDEKAIFILTCHQKFDKAYYERRRKIDQLESDKVFQKNIYGIDMETNRNIAALERQNYGLTQYRKADYYGLTQNQFLYYKQILFSRGLFHDEGLGNLNVTPFDLMGLTELGYKFLEFIVAEN